VPAPSTLLEAVAHLSAASGYEFDVSDDVVPGTQLYVVYTEAHDLPERYTLRQGALGFRAPGMYPDASPEDSFFIAPSTIKLVTPNPERNSTDLNRASATPGFLPSSILAGASVLVFSWHIWDRFSWRPRTHTLVDHYTHCVRRFEQPEHG